MNIANWFEGEPVTDARMNAIVNDLNSLAAGSVGLVVLTASGTWVVPAGITSDTRIRVWVVGGGGASAAVPPDFDVQPGQESKSGYSVFTGFSEGQSVPVTVGAVGGDSIFNLVSLKSFGGTGPTGSTPSAPTGTAPAGVLWVPRKCLSYGGSDQAGAVIIEW